MNQKERNILQLEEQIKDTIENDIAKQQTQNRKIKIKDIKMVGKVIWKDKINGKPISKNLYIVEKEITDIGENGNKNSRKSINYYLDDECIAASLDMDNLVYRENFKISEPEKIKAVEELLKNTTREEIENNSLNKLHKKELAEVLSAQLGKEISDNEIEDILRDLDETENEELPEKEKGNKTKEKNLLNKKDAEQIKSKQVQRVDLNKVVDGDYTLGKRLDLEEYDYLYTIYSEDAKDINPGLQRNNTTYSLVGVKKDGQAKVLNDEFEIDKSVGNSANRMQSKIRANGTATRDNNDLSVYTRKSNGVSIGCENNRGSVDMFLYQKTLEENENVGIQIETSRTPVIKLETKKIMSKNKGINQKEKVQDEIEEHTKQGCAPDDIKDFDGDERTFTHEHIDINYYVEDILNYENSEGEKKIEQLFTKQEVEDKLLRELKENSEKMTIEQIIQNVKEEMNQDAEIFLKEHTLPS